MTDNDTLAAASFDADFVKAILAEMRSGADRGILAKITADARAAFEASERASRKGGRVEGEETGR